MTNGDPFIPSPVVLVLAAALVLALCPNGACLDNLVPNSDFITSEGNGPSPHFWYHGRTDVEGVTKSEFSVGLAGSPPLRALGIKGGNDRSGEWWCRLQGLQIGKRYILAFKVYRERFDDGVYPEVRIFDKRLRLSNNLTYGAWQDFTLEVTASDVMTTLVFVNDNPGEFFFSSPYLTEAAAIRNRGETLPAKRAEVPKLDFFPLIAYGSTIPDLPFVRDMGFNGVVVDVTESNLDEMIAASQRYGVKLVVHTESSAAIERLSGYENTAGWYVEDEPEGRSVPVEEIMGRVRKIQERDSSHPAFMAIVRPEFVSYYREAADVILMDQYPLPHHPITWLSKSIDEAANHADGRGVWAVIQIFGGQGWKGKGWDREPTFDEMKALSYLAIVHGARGLFFYTVKDGNFDLREDRAHLSDVKSLVHELGSLNSFYRAEPTGTPHFLPDPPYEYAPDGTRPVHARIFRDGSRFVMIAVNVLDKEVRGRLSGLDDSIPALDEYFSGKRYVVKERNIIDDFRPYEVKLYMSGRDFRKVRIVAEKGDAERARFYAEIADKEPDRILGLMFRGLASEDRAMLFEFETPRDVAMHALYIKEPLDIIFFDEENRVSSVVRNVQACFSPSACTHYRSERPSAAVMEVKAGIADKFHIGNGDKLEFY